VSAQIQTNPLADQFGFNFFFSQFHKFQYYGSQSEWMQNWRCDTEKNLLRSVSDPKYLTLELWETTLMWIELIEWNIVLREFVNLCQNGITFVHSQVGSVVLVGFVLQISTEFFQTEIQILDTKMTPDFCFLYLNINGETFVRKWYHVFRHLP